MEMPPGVYFEPTTEECVREYLIPWIEVGDVPTHGAVFPADVYRHSPGELGQLFPPGHARGMDRSWYFVSLPESVSGKGGVATGGKWVTDQKPSDFDGGTKRGYKFDGGNGKTRWLMEVLELSDVPAVFCRIYVSPRAEDDVKRAILGEDCVAVDVHDRPKPTTVVVGQEYFDMLAARMPASCVRAHGGGHVVAAAEQPPGVYDPGQVGVALPPDDTAGHDHYIHPASPPPQPPVVYGHQQGPAALPYFPDHYFNGHNAAAFDYPPALPPIHVAPQQDEEGTTHHAPKKPRPTTYGASPALDANNGDAADLQQEGPAPAELMSSRTASSSPPLLIDDALQPSIEFDPCQQAPENPWLDGFKDPSYLMNVSFNGDFGATSQSQSQSLVDGLPPLPPDLSNFSVDGMCSPATWITVYNGPWFDDTDRSEQ